MKRLAIIASGELGMQVAHWAAMDGGYIIAGFFDDVELAGTDKNGYKILGGTDDIDQSFGRGDFDCLMIGIGYKHLDRRRELFSRFKGRIPFANIIHSTCYIDATAQLGEGILIYPGCIIDKKVFISDNVLLNIGVTICHDSYIGAHSFLSPGVTIAGFVRIGECANLGIRTTIIDNLNICDNVQTGGGALIVSNLEQPGLYIGSPVKLYKK
ncbi:MAG: acetyltransferase [Bacteroidetes bacterium]|nr:acetyltransferase [Bacteroidota bacterium]